MVEGNHELEIDTNQASVVGVAQTVIRDAGARYVSNPRTPRLIGVAAAVLVALAGCTSPASPTATLPPTAAAANSTATSAATMAQATRTAIPATPSAAATSSATSAATAQASDTA